MTSLQSTICWTILASVDLTTSPSHQPSTLTSTSRQTDSSGPSAHHSSTCSSTRTLTSRQRCSSRTSTSSLVCLIKASLLGISYFFVTSSFNMSIIVEKEENIKKIRISNIHLLGDIDINSKAERFIRTFIIIHQSHQRHQQRSTIRTPSVDLRRVIKAASLASAVSSVTSSLST